MNYEILKANLLVPDEKYGRISKVRFVIYLKEYDYRHEKYIEYDWINHEKYLSLKYSIDQFKFLLYDKTLTRPEKNIIVAKELLKELEEKFI